jgi:hypothetical protein
MATGAAAAAHRSSFSEWRYPPCLAIAIEVPEALKIFESDDHIDPHLGSGAFAAIHQGAGMNFIEIELTQCRVSFGVRRSPSTHLDKLAIVRFGAEGWTSAARQRNGWARVL